MKSLSIIPMVAGFVISLALIGFAAVIYKGDHVTSLTIISIVGGHWLGVGSIATGKTLSELASSTGTQAIKDAANILKEGQSQ